MSQVSTYMFCTAHDEYFDTADFKDSRKHTSCPRGGQGPADKKMWSLNHNEVVYYLNQFHKMRKFIRQLRMFIESAGMV